MNKFILSWDIKDADVDTLRDDMAALVLRIDSEATIEQPLLSCYIISSEKDIESWFESFESELLGKFVYFTFSQIAKNEDDYFLHGEVPKSHLQDSLEEDGGILDKAKEKNETRRGIRKYIRSYLECIDNRQ